MKCEGCNNQTTSDWLYCSEACWARHNDHVPVTVVAPCKLPSGVKINKDPMRRKGAHSRLGTPR